MNRDLIHWKPNCTVSEFNTWYASSNLGLRMVALIVTLTIQKALRTSKMHVMRKRLK